MIRILLLTMSTLPKGKPLHSSISFYTIHFSVLMVLYALLSFKPQSQIFPSCMRPGFFVLLMIFLSFFCCQRVSKEILFTLKSGRDLTGFGILRPSSLRLCSIIIMFHKIIVASCKAAHTTRVYIPTCIYQNEYPNASKN